jgi:hypothetical protein
MKQMPPLLLVLQELQVAGVCHIHAEYNGSGDSGQFQSIEGLDVRGCAVAVTDEQFDTLDYHIGELLPDGWEINEGSYGVVEIDVETLRARVNHMNRVETFEVFEHELG